MIYRIKYFYKNHPFEQFNARYVCESDKPQYVKTKFADSKANTVRVLKKQNFLIYLINKASWLKIKTNYVKMIARKVETIMEKRVLDRETQKFYDTRSEEEKEIDKTLNQLGYKALKKYEKELKERKEIKNNGKNK